MALPLDRTLTYRLPAELAAVAQVGSLVQVPVGRQTVTAISWGRLRRPPRCACAASRQCSTPSPASARAGAPVPLAGGLLPVSPGRSPEPPHPGGARPSGARQETWATPIPVAEAPPAQTPGTQGPGPVDAPEGDRRRPARDLQARCPGCRPSLRRLADLGLIKLAPRLALQDPLKSQPPIEAETPLSLVPEQEEALTAVAQGLASGVFAPFLLHGVTASGKTEVYLSAAAQALALKRQVLVLLPEIALTHPVAQAFRQRFGPGSRCCTAAFRRPPVWTNGAASCWGRWTWW